MEHFAIHKPAKIQSSLLCCGNVDSAVYFYHSDHLGSASWITNSTGSPIQHLQYMPYGEPFVNERISSSSYEERYTFTGKERDSETGYSYFGARFYDSDLMTGWLSVDPQSDKFPNISPYAYCNWNPVKLVDPDGEEPSTHTDENGNVVAVFNDGDNGVYRHKGDMEQVKLSIEQKYSIYNTSAGGEYMGESLHSLSFSNQSTYNKYNVVEPADIKIDFNSNELTEFVSGVVNSDPSAVKYFINAGTGGEWDIKKHIPNGSLLYGKYASPRDAGNFLAGIVASSGSKIRESIIQFGYGAYNLSGNNKIKTASITYSVAKVMQFNPALGLTMFHIIQNGEDKLSQLSIDLGKKHFKK